MGDREPQQESLFASEPPPAGAEAQVRVRHGVRATEQALLEEVLAEADAALASASSGLSASAGSGGASPLARPLRIVVPSGSLRQHVSARLVARAGRSLVGVVVHTLEGVARQILSRSGPPSPGGDELFPVLVRQLARDETVLRDSLDALQDGYGVVTASVADLLDAGFEPALAPGLEEYLAEELGGVTGARARAVVRVAARLQETMAAHGLEHRSSFVRRAAQALRDDADAVLPARGLWIYGFADATGVQIELLLALVQAAGARVLVDRPRDPADPGRPAPGVGFTDRLLGHLQGAASVEESPSAAPASPRPVLLRAPGAQAEVRAVAERVRGLLDAGTKPESVAIVARDLTGYRRALAVHLDRVGVPYSGGPGFLTPAGRRVRALLDLLQQRERSAADRWLDATDHFGRERVADLRLGLHGIGVGRLGDVAALDLDDLLAGKPFYRLPVRLGLSAIPAEEGDSEGEDPEMASATRLQHRQVSRATLAWALETANALGERFARQRRARTLADQLSELRALLSTELRWTPETAGAAELHACIAALERSLPGGLAITSDEFVLMLRRGLREAGLAALGGAGGGLQVLSVAEARGRSFAHLALLGLNRDVFPRSVAEDPLLPDAVRGGLAVLLPDIPIKGRGFAEERYLFAQLCSASESLTLSWQAVNDDGKERPPSPLLERLRLAIPDLEVAHARPALESPEVVRPAFEQAIRAGVDAAPSRFAELLPVALAEATEAAPEALAAARVAVLAELDGRGDRRQGLGPYYGFVGDVRTGADPRRTPLYVTRLESMAYCAWQSFLTRQLGLEPVPDALAALPDVTPLLIGNVVHRVLEELVRTAGGACFLTIEDASASGALPVAWPDEAGLAELLDRHARIAAREEGIVMPGVAVLLARRARPLLERVRALDWEQETDLHGVIGAELEGSVSVQDATGSARPLRFRADRVDFDGKGMRLTDYKAGRPISEDKQVSTRRRKLLLGIAQGRRLQAAAYAFAADDPSTLGRYLFATEDADEACARFEIPGDDVEARHHFETAVRVLLNALDRGSFVPRLLQPNGEEESSFCANCEVSSACLRGDSGARRRLRDWLGGGRSQGEAERAAAALLQLGEPGA